jgi:ATP-dependent DNA helicase RecG
MMNRLLQGDVGAGKTVVAAFAIYAAVISDSQAVLMVPTEILAEQHFQSITKLLAPFEIVVECLTGSTTNKHRKAILDGLQLGLVHVLIGTHALIQGDVYFRKLGLIVTDEQHRFGVNQRTALRNKGWNPDVLSMTATPIPRTLAITTYGDLDVSIIDELPKGRLPIMTKWHKHKQWTDVLKFILTELEIGRQAYLICPLIEESEQLDVQNAVEMYQQLCQQWPDIRIGLLHGRLSNAEKEQVMNDFKQHQIQLLVSTTVVEVGVDVPNATCMVIYDADRFGLSQLHQLRGRVGRGVHQSYCFLIADPQSEYGRERMNVMCATQDGFEISRKDLELRGAGDFFGTKQSGMPDFKLGDVVHDFALLEMARDDVSALLALDDFWTSHRYLELRQWLQNDVLFSGSPMD